MDSSPFLRDPVGEACREFEAVLTRLEKAITGYSPGYGLVENLADIETVKKFINSGMWDSLDHAQQQRYQARVVTLQQKAPR